MAADVAEFYDRLEELVNRGTVFTSLFPEYTARAVEFLEKNYSFAYMHTVDEDFLDVIEGVQEYDQPERMKSPILWRLFKEDGTYLDLEKVAASDLGKTNDPTRANPIYIPRCYWMKGRVSMVLNVSPTYTYPAEFHYFEFTDWSEVELGDSPWLVVNAEQLLLAQTVMLLGPRLRDPKLMALVKDMKEEALRTNAISEEENSAGDMDPVMQYGDSDQ